MVKLAVGDIIGVEEIPMVCIVTQVKPLCVVNAEGRSCYNATFKSWEPRSPKYGQEWSLWAMSLNLFKVLHETQED